MTLESEMPRKFAVPDRIVNCENDDDTRFIKANTMIPTQHLDRDAATELPV
jgi:hypothetical protein